MHFSKKKPLHSTELFKIFFSLLTLSTAFLQKASGPGKNIAQCYITSIVIVQVLWHVHDQLYEGVLWI